MGTGSWVCSATPSFVLSPEIFHDIDHKFDLVDVEDEGHLVQGGLDGDIEPWQIRDIGETGKIVREVRHLKQHHLGWDWIDSRGVSRSWSLRILSRKINDNNASVDDDHNLDSTNER